MRPVSSSTSRCAHCSGSSPGSDFPPVAFHFPTLIPLLAFFRRSIRRLTTWQMVASMTKRQRPCHPCERYLRFGSAEGCDLTSAVAAEVLSRHKTGQGVLPNHEIGHLSRGSLPSPLDAGAGLRSAA